jgi:hypothetical protein
VVVAAGLTLRDAVVPLLMVCVTLSDQVTLNGAMPVSVAVIVADAPGQIAPPPLTVAVGSVFTVIVAEPLDVPVQFASVIELIVYVFVAAGLTLREAVVPLLIVCVTLSDQITVHGAVPVSVALIVAEPPGQIAAVPLTTAAGSARTVTAVGDEAALQPFAFVTVTL